VNKASVQAALAGGPWGYSKLTTRRYKVRADRKTMRRATLVERIYDDLYNARNAFLHGNPVSARTLRFDRRGDRPSLVTLAPALYHGALLAFLQNKVPGGPDEALPGNLSEVDAARHYMDRREGLSNVQNALAKATEREDDDES
jgi:hypothetical protein